MIPLDGVEIVPKLWIGSNRTCDACRPSFNYICVNVGTRSHTQDQRCNFIPIIGSNGFVDYGQVALLERLLAARWPSGGAALIHGPDALTYSPLAMALYIQSRYQLLNLAQAYTYIFKAQPGAQNLMQLAQPVSSNTGWRGAT